MNIGYRIVKVDSSEHGILVRYFTDKVTEMDLATSFNEDGTVKLHADGYPLSTRTDMFMTIYETPTPPYSKIINDIKIRAPVDWLKIQEDIKDKKVDTTLIELKEHVGESSTFTTDEFITLRDEMNQAATANIVNRAAETTLLLDYANTDTKMSSALANLVIHAIHSGTTVPL